MMHAVVAGALLVNPVTGPTTLQAVAQGFKIAVQVVQTAQSIPIQTFQATDGVGKIFFGGLFDDNMPRRPRRHR